MSELRLHPCFDRCYRLYRNAVLDWHSSGAIQQAARTLGMNARAYADARLVSNQFQWVAVGTGEPFTREHADLAYRDAIEPFSESSAVSRPAGDAA